MGDRAGRPANRWPLALRVWGNPVARGADRAEALLIIGLTLIWLLSVPVIATVASAEWTSVDARVAADQSADVAVVAVLQADAPPLTAGDAHAPSLTSPTAPAIWLGRDGQSAHGMVTVPAGARAGQRVTIWLDPAGAVVDRPMTTQVAAGLVVLAALGGWVGLGVVFAGVWWTARVVLNRHRAQLWEQGWTNLEAGLSPQ
ncbi:Rv1733c family protein [Nakamurella multipartita]|jgi:hypothetical protein|uniref:Transmembrane protein n=1 Tax=Nakamurella multipartita (strain ATCC 700099 / DSM 44233 / CIP 104796 / JCM 9543 / NBRC 105858 / Y-104) TaxID=479431 RepID=C8XI13_NAKMY|nr:hypothetical protein [Nakamurella multipartita]ACV78382.1 hypothetical protein Namu_1997 [Nakamurella multipartita DSM 44233]